MRPKVIAFPFAGGNKYSFQPLKTELRKGGVDMIVLELPGRGARVRESFLDNMEVIVEDVFQRTVQESEGEYLLYGHSLGGLIGYLVCQRLEQEFRSLPSKLIVSGIGAPGKHSIDRYHDLPRGEFWQKVGELGGVPQDILLDTQLMDIFEPVLRSDFKAIEGYKYVPVQPLITSIDVFHGTEESLASEEIVGWHDESSGQVTIRELSGGHFFILDHYPYLAQHMTETLQTLQTSFYV